MRFGICVMANIDEIGFFNHAEALGYDSVWVTDSQMLFSDCYAVLALAARQTTRLRLGPGAAIVPAPLLTANVVQANGLDEPQRDRFVPGAPETLPAAATDCTWRIGAAVPSIYAVQGAGAR